MHENLLYARNSLALVLLISNNKSRHVAPNSGTFIVVASRLVFSIILALTCWGVSSRAEELTSKVGRDGKNEPRDVLTVQLLLNQISPERGGAEPLLDPDYLVGPATIAAIERFQRINLNDEMASGVVVPGDETFRKLLDIVGMESLRDRVVRLALGESRFWRDGQRKETDPKVTARLKEYWLSVGRDFSDEQLQDSNFQNVNPWSAAFVSWIFKQAGAGDQFKYASAHWKYVAAAKQNRELNSDNPIRAYQISEVAIAAGDVVVKKREGSTASYENISLGHTTHGDIVVTVGQGQAVTVGGNVSNSVTTTMVSLSESDRVTDLRYFAVVRWGP